MKNEKAKLICSLAQATDKTVAAESCAMKSEERLAAMEARFCALTSPNATDALARKTAEVKSLTLDVTEARGEAAAAGCRISVPEVQMGELVRKHQEPSSVTKEATAREDALKVELKDLRKRYSVLRGEREKSSEFFRRQWELREVRLKKERDGFQDRAEQLSGDVLKLSERLTKERKNSGNLAEEVNPSRSSVRSG